MKIGEDIFWNVETLFLTNNIKYVEEKGYIYRYKREGSLTNSSNQEMEKDSYIKLVRNIEFFLKENGNKMNDISKLRLELEKEFWQIKVKKEIDLNSIFFKVKKFFKKNSSKENYIIKKVLRDILRYKELNNCLEIPILDIFFWKNGIYDYKTLSRIIKNKIRRLKNEKSFYTSILSIKFRR